MSDLSFRSDRGSVIVIVAVFMTTAAIFGAFVIDVGNWFVHKRHLQVQADAAALAAASGFRYPCDGTVDANITAIANSYGGQTYNAPLKQTAASNRHEVINDRNYYNQSKPNDSDLPGTPCSKSFVDVKMTETDLPWFMDVLKLGPVKFINAQARVAIKILQSSDRSLPVSAIEPDPKTVKATLYDANKQEIGTALLDHCTASGGAKVCDSSLHKLAVTMDNSANSGQFDYSHMTVKITLSGSTDTTCGDSLVDCYDNVLWIRGWSDQPTVGATSQPRLRGVALLNGGCSDAYFTDGVACNATINAFVDFQAGVNQGTQASVTANVNGTTVTLLPPSGAGQPWTNVEPVPIPASAGTVPITIDWVQQSGTIVNGGTTYTCTTQNTGTTPNKNPCFGNFEGPFQPGNNATKTTIQQPFSASSTASGPLSNVQIGEELTPGVFTYDENNLQRCSSTYTCPTHNFIFKVSIPGALQLSQPSDPPIPLRVIGNQNQAVDCDPNVPNIRNEIERPTSPTDLTHGCHPLYTANTGQSCPNSQTVLWGSPQPWPCVVVSTGGTVGQVAQGLNQRFENDEQGNAGCPNKNNWPNYPSTDPRIIEVFVTPYGSFSGTGNGSVPVIGLAAFYVTGWFGSNGDPNPCTGVDNTTTAGFTAKTDPATLFGHFIKYVDPTGTPGTQFCNLTDPSDIFACVPVLTK